MPAGYTVAQRVALGNLSDAVKAWIFLMTKSSIGIEYQSVEKQVGSQQEITTQ
ncbi:hypothetical protein [Rhizobium sp. L43]|uniref:hypothetical protein n=1 Tax=Rhizobium sp. L43 TaxID=2035452 RepID=UPI0015CF6F00|nr:hypothetical protein [Rhizobium sp. L43]